MLPGIGRIKPILDIVELRADNPVQFGLAFHISVRSIHSYCREVTPFKAQTQLKLNGSYPLPGDVVLAATFQNISGPSYEATYPATSEEIALSLGRPLAGGTRTANVPLVAPFTLFEGRTQRLDVRVSKIFRVRRVRLQLNLDSYNVLNSDAIRSVNSTFDARWRQPNAIIDPRHVQIGGQISF
jgi:hypothetical protein